MPAQQRSMARLVPRKESLRTPGALQVYSAPSLSQYTSCSQAESQAKLCSHTLLHSLILRRIPTLTRLTSARRGSRVGWKPAALAPSMDPCHSRGHLAWREGGCQRCLASFSKKLTAPSTDCAPCSHPLKFWPQKLGGGVSMKGNAGAHMDSLHGNSLDPSSQIKREFDRVKPS